MIPKIIHYCWFGGKKIPQSVKSCIETWKKFCPDYEIILWNEKNFDVSAHPFMKKAYEDKAWAFVTDYARLKVVYENGGIYLDTDVELLKKLDTLLYHKSYFGLQQGGDFIATGLGFGAEKGASILKKLMDAYDSIEYNSENRLSVSCPRVNSKIFVENGYVKTNGVFENDEFAVYPACYFDPYSTQKKTNLKCEKTFSIHHYDASWSKWNVKLKKKIISMIGEERIIKIRQKISLL